MRNERRADEHRHTLEQGTWNSAEEIKTQTFAGRCDLVPVLRDRKLAVLDVVDLPASDAVNAAVASDCHPMKPRKIQILLKYVAFSVHLP
jgi:hypothetical protein